MDNSGFLWKVPMAAIEIWGNCSGAEESLIPIRGRALIRCQSLFTK